MITSNASTLGADGDAINLYYGAADTCLGLITARIADVLDWLRSQPSTPSQFARE